MASSRLETSSEQTHTLSPREPLANENERVDLPITGMTCAACARRIERRLKKIPGVQNAGVNFATERATVLFNPQKTDIHQLIEAVREIGYDANEPALAASLNEDEEKSARESEYLKLRRKFLFAAALSLPVLVIAMSHGRIAFLDFSGVNYLQLALTTPVVLYSGWQFYRADWAALLHRAADMNTLIAVGTGAAYLYSVAATLAPNFFSGAANTGAMPGMGGMNNPPAPPVYFEAASVIIALILLGRLLEARARGRTGDAIRHLIGLQPKTARVVRDDSEINLPVADVVPGDLILVRPGEKIPVDGVVESGDVFIERLGCDEQFATQKFFARACQSSLTSMSGNRRSALQNFRQPFCEAGARHYTVKSGLFGSLLERSLHVREEAYERNVSHSLIRLQCFGQQERITLLRMEVCDDE